jgi:hypothetical protein
MEFIIYTRAGCHLCDVMAAELGSLTEGYPVRIQMIDVDSDPVLRERFGLRVPVLMAGEEEICAARLVPARIRSLLRAAN